MRGRWCGRLRRPRGCGTPAGRTQRRRRRRPPACARTPPPDPRRAPPGTRPTPARRFPPRARAPGGILAAQPPRFAIEADARGRVVGRANLPLQRRLRLQPTAVEVRRDRLERTRQQDPLARLRRAHGVVHAPDVERRNHGAELRALLRQPVAHFLPPRLLVTFDDARRFQFAQPQREPLGRDVVQPAKQVGEALGPPQQVPHDEQRPLFADHLEGAGDGAEVVVGTRPGHLDSPMVSRR